MSGFRFPLLLVDLNTQHDFFAPDGALPVLQAAVLRRRIRGLMESARRERLAILSGVDLHLPADPEFAAGTLPPHALAGTPGQQKIPETQVRHALLFPPDGRRRPWPAIRELYQGGAQACLEKASFDLASNPAFRQILLALEPRALKLFGAVLEWDLCATALSLRGMGFEVAILQDLSGERDPQAAHAARLQLSRRGVRFETAAEALRSSGQLRNRLERG